MKELFRSAARAVWSVKAELIRSAIGIAGVALVVAGVWSLLGWAWAAIVAGLPVAGFYLYGELQAIAPPREG